MRVLHKCKIHICFNLLPHGYSTLLNMLNIVKYSVDNSTSPEKTQDVLHEK